MFVTKAWDGDPKGLPRFRQHWEGGAEQYLQRHQGQGLGLPTEGSSNRGS